MDNLEVLLDKPNQSRFQNEVEAKKKIESYFNQGIITAEAINFIRGRSITHTYLIIDEAQNLTPKQVKGIITRVGKGTKIVLLGDPQQIDNPLLDEKTNGLSYASEKMKGSPLCYQLTMLPDECLRSQLAYDAAQRM
jgi:PhoH-like ATPase